MLPGSCNVIWVKKDIGKEPGWLKCAEGYPVACSRLRDSGEGVNWEKEREKKGRGWGDTSLIFVLSQLSESLEQASCPVASDSADVEPFSCISIQDWLLHINLF